MEIYYELKDKFDFGYFIKINFDARNLFFVSATNFEEKFCEIKNTLLLNDVQISYKLL
ncbi:hypothetical protein YS40_141 [Thermus phage phiYS40]|uniref:hypothetical protein n=1 Tax=Thermus phage phiYS40 TaxID=407392 RepID=UPI0000E68A03|nr:hypothetical protein YS40_141 [Thermus phage phiYS40]ABJ91535.1 hypothetical protein YS40_141 [Thermus phage phiYS40]BAK53659.1 hypothetical protein YSP_141 [Thermus phage phiYS40]